VGETTGLDDENTRPSRRESRSYRAWLLQRAIKSKETNAITSFAPGIRRTHSGAVTLSQTTVARQAIMCLHQPLCHHTHTHTPHTQVSSDLLEAPAQCIPTWWREAEVCRAHRHSARL
jgi:hypothetical protein